MYDEIMIQNMKIKKATQISGKYVRFFLKL